MTAAHAYELPPEPEPGALAAAVDAAEHGHVIPLTRNGRPVAVIQPVDPDQAWYWTKEWQAGEREVERDRKLGVQNKVYTDLDEFFAALDSGR